MKNLFSADSLKILESLSFTRTLYAFDFDGTLAKIVKNPADASIRASTDALLKELSQYAPTAIVTGRSVADLKCLLRFTPPFLIGNHGLEGLDASPDALKLSRGICEKWKELLQTQLPEDQLKAGVAIEDKAFSLAIHYRRCATKKKAKLAILKAAANLEPEPRIILGKCVVNLLPPNAPHKGAALLELMRRTEIKSAFYIGDDDTDEDVFALPNARILTVRVGKKALSQAQYFIQEQSEVDRVLKTILRFYQATSLTKSAPTKAALA